MKLWQSIEPNVVLFVSASQLCGCWGIGTESVPLPSAYNAKASAFAITGSELRLLPASCSAVAHSFSPVCATIFFARVSPCVNRLSLQPRLARG
eukprot:scaffold1246_cov134-Cylindrotheca_fusiformis.AAC.22